MEVTTLTVPNLTTDQMIEVDRAMMARVAMAEGDWELPRPVPEPTLVPLA